MDFGLSFEELLATFVPIFAYWVYSGVYEFLGIFCENYRIHSKEDENEKNLVTKWTVFKGILLQQFIQVIATLLLFMVTPEDDISVAQKSESLIVVAGQFIVAMLVLDTWQYFVHRGMHQINFFYKHVHSHHHKVIVPFAFGALYSHPVEGLFMDTLSGLLAVIFSGMSTRTSIYFITFAYLKTVDDHCGLLLPGNPYHLLFNNNTAYHDVHHQLYGTKYNFSQPFFVIWDKIMGTYMPYSLVKREGGGFQVQPGRNYKAD